MNSHQRRVIRRYWRYTGFLSDDISFKEYKEVRAWCKGKFGKIGYRWGNTFDYLDFSFRHKEDFTIFALRWL